MLHINRDLELLRRATGVAQAIQALADEVDNADAEDEVEGDGEDEDEEEEYAAAEESDEGIESVEEVRRKPDVCASARAVLTRWQAKGRVIKEM
jgi:hypothetical protein